MERRAYPRIEVSHPVIYISDIYPSPKTASTIDLSLGGTKIETLHSLAKGERLQISIAVHPEVIKFRAKVVYVLWPDAERLQAGVRFDEISEHDKLYLRQYLFHVLEQQAITTLFPKETPL